MGAQLFSYNEKSVKDTFNYLFAFPQYPYFNRHVWVKHENELAKKMKEIPLNEHGEVYIFTKLSNKKLIFKDGNFDLQAQAPLMLTSKTISESIPIPNSLSTLAVFVYIDPNTGLVYKVETIAYMGNNNKDKYDQMSELIPLEILNALGFNPLKVQPEKHNLKIVE